MAEMQDGVRLAADVYKPDGASDLPVLLRRTPYGKERLEIGNATTLAEAGYTVVIQDIRGRGASEGEIEWIFGDPSLMSDADDGSDSVEWAAELAGAAHQVGTFGCSYDAWTQLQLAPLQPPHLAGLAVAGMGPDLRDWTKGIFDTGRRLLWTYTFAADARPRTGDSSGPPDSHFAKEDWRLQQGKWIWSLPLDSIPSHVFGDFDSPLRSFGANPTHNAFDFRLSHSNIEVPSLFLTGWWDRVPGTAENFAGMINDGPESTKSRHRLVVGPWSHHPQTYTRKVGIVDHGPGADVSFERLVAGFYDWILKGDDPGIGSGPAVRLFLTGSNVWVGDDKWPPDSEPTALFLRGSGVAGGSLAIQGPVDDPPDSFLYDPKDPVMSVMAMDAHHAPLDQRVLDYRKDILRFEVPINDATTVVGIPLMMLWAASSAVDTDWTVKLVDVFPDGLAINLASGIARACYRDGYESPKLLTPGEVYQYRIPFSRVGHTFLPGHKIRVEVSSSDFPDHDRNHNTGRNPWTDGELLIARQTVFHDTSRPSHLLLPVVTQGPAAVGGAGV